MEKNLPRIERDIIHVFRTTDNKLTIHTNSTIKAGTELKVGNDMVIVQNILRDEQSAYYKANYYEVQFKKITN